MVNAWTIHSSVSTSEYGMYWLSRSFSAHESIAVGSMTSTELLSIVTGPPQSIP